MIDSQAQTPPYLSYTTFKSTIQNLALDGKLPRQIDRTVFPTLSGSSQKVVIAALRFFELITDAGVPSERLAKLSKGDDQKWKEYIGTLLTEKFPDQVNMLPDASPKGFRDAFLVSFPGIGPSIVDTCIRFLVAAARDAGIPVSGHLLQRKIRVAVATRRERGLKQAKQTLLGPDYAEACSPTSPAESFRVAMLEKFPSFDPTWNPEQQQAWFTAYQKLIEMNETRTAAS